jgi:hypothetical protein
MVKHIGKTLMGAVSKFTSGKSNFGMATDEDGNLYGDINYVQITQDSSQGTMFIFIFILSLLIIIYGFKSITMMCPGEWTGVKVILLLLLLMSGGNIGIIYIIMAYMLKMKIC